MANDNKVTQQKELNRLTLEYEKLKKKGLEKDEGTKALKEKILSLSDEINKSATDRLELAEKELENATQNHAIMEKIAQLDGDREGLQDTLIAQQESIVKLKEAELIALVESVKLGKQTEDQIINRKKELQDELKLEREKLKLQQDQAEAYDAVEGKVADTVSGLLGSVDASKGFVGQLLLASEHTGGMEGVISNIGKGLATALKPANVMAGLFAKVKESSMAAFLSMDNFRADLAKAGASLEQYGGLMANTTDQTVAAGVSMKDAQQSILALHSGMSSFNTMNKADQQVLTNTTAIMNKLGVDAQTSAGNLDILTKSMGMNAKEADKATKEIAATAQALGVSQQKMAADFASAAPVLSAHGEAGVQIFRKLAAQSKATGIEMGALLGIANQFDTFEGAAEAAGKLNAVLGTQLNSIELLTASEDERIKILQQSVAASGKSWESMNKFEKQTVAAAAGISDVNEAGKLFGTTAQQMENAAGAAEKMALADKELAKQAASASTASEKVKIIMERFAVAMTPVINTVHWLLDVIMATDQFFQGAFIPTMLALVSIMFIASKAQAAFNVLSGIAITLDKIKSFWAQLKTADSKKELIMNKLLKKSTEELTEAEKKAADQNKKTQNTGGGFLKFLAKLGAILKRNAKGFLAFGAAMLMVGGGIAIAALGLAEFVKSFAALTGEQLIAATLGLLLFLGAMVAIAFFMLSGGGPTAVAGMLAFGAAFLMMGIGIALAAYGLSLMVPQFVILAGIGASLITAALAVGMLTIAFGSLGMLSFVMIPIIIVLGKLTAGILALALALSFIKTDELRAVADMAQGLGSITLDSAVAFGKAMLETRETIVAIAREPEAALALTTMAQAFAPSPAGGGGTTTTTNNITGTAASAGGDSGNREIVLKLNKDVFARAVVNIFEKEQDLNKLG
jgi:hypothetical protein